VVQEVGVIMLGEATEVDVVVAEEVVEEEEVEGAEEGLHGSEHSTVNRWIW